MELDLKFPQFDCEF